MVAGHWGRPDGEGPACLSQVIPCLEGILRVVCKTQLESLEHKTASTHSHRENTEPISHVH